jgi:von Willebrand factor type A domain
MRGDDRNPARIWRGAKGENMLCRVSAVLIALGSFAKTADVATFHTTVSLVKADAYVYNRQTHAPILDLQASDFKILDENQPRELAFFEDDSGPVDLLLLLDISGSVRDILPQIADSATGALSALQEGDRCGVMAFTKTTAVTQSLTGELKEVARGIRDATTLRIGNDTDINQALWSAADYLHGSGGTARRAILIITDNMQETRVPDSLVDEQVSEAGIVLDGLLLRGPLGLPHITHAGILGFARNSGGEVIEGNHPAGQLAEMIRRIKFRYGIHFRPVETKSPQPRKIHIELSEEARRRYPNAVIRARRIYFPLATYRPTTEILPGQRIAANGTAGWKLPGVSHVPTIE